MDKETQHAMRRWGGVLGASALVVAIAVGVVMQLRTPRPQVASRTQAAVRTQDAARPLTAAERKTSEALWVEQKKLDTDIARVMAAGPDSRRRVPTTIAKHFNVPEKLVTDLRGRKIGYGEITVTLALSQQLMKRERMPHKKALDRVLALRKSGEGWGAIARTLGLKLGDALGHVAKLDQQLAKLHTGKARAAKG